MPKEETHLYPLDKEDLVFEDESNGKWVSIKGIKKILSGCRLKNFPLTHPKNIKKLSEVTIRNVANKLYKELNDAYKQDFFKMTTTMSSNNKKLLVINYMLASEISNYYDETPEYPSIIKNIDNANLSKQDIINHITRYIERANNEKNNHDIENLPESLATYFYNHLSKLNDNYTKLIDIQKQEIKKLEDNEERLQSIITSLANLMDIKDYDSVSLILHQME